MKCKRNSMAKKAMVFVTIAFFTLTTAGCGESASYEAVRTVQDEGQSEAGNSGGNGTSAGSADRDDTSAGDTGGNGSSAENSDGSGAAENGSADENLICVYVCGAVVSPGVMRLPEGSRVCDAIAAAGGFTGEADRIHTNLASLLTDGQQITVPTVSEAAEMDFPKAGTSGAGDASSAQGKAGDSGGNGLVNINTADAATLQTLSGIGAARAADIIAYREENGGFSCIEDITKVSGIGDKMFQKIKDRITV